MDIILIFVAVAIHYISDYMKNNPEYTCPEYCEVDHEHYNIKELDKQVKILENKKGEQDV